MKNINHNLYIKYFISKTKYDKIIINHIMHNHLFHLYHIFREYLIFNDPTEFLKRFYFKEELNYRVSKLGKYYSLSSIIFPNYTVFSEKKYLYKNIFKKQQIIDKNENMIKKNNKIQNETLENNFIFDTKIYESIYKDTDNSQIDSLFNIKRNENNNETNDTENDLIDLEKFVFNLSEAVSNYNKNKIYSVNVLTDLNIDSNPKYHNEKLVISPLNTLSSFSTMLNTNLSQSLVKTNKKMLFIPKLNLINTKSILSSKNIKFNKPKMKLSLNKDTLTLYKDNTFRNNKKIETQKDLLILPNTERKSYFDKKRYELITPKDCNNIKNNIKNNSSTKKIINIGDYNNKIKCFSQNSYKNINSQYLSKNKQFCLSIGHLSNNNITNNTHKKYISTFNTTYSNLKNNKGIKLKISNSKKGIRKKLLQNEINILKKK